MMMIMLDDCMAGKHILYDGAIVVDREITVL